MLSTKGIQPQLLNFSGFLSLSLAAAYFLGELEPPSEATELLIKKKYLICC